jgi:hypothetical protein
MIRMANGSTASLTYMHQRIDCTHTLVCTLMIFFFFLRYQRLSMEFMKKLLIRSGVLLLMALVMVEAVTHSESTDPRQLQQQTLNYRANYSADFQYWRSPNCDGDAPILQVSCFGQGMTVPNTSDTTIVCTKIEEPRYANGANGTTYECRNTCNETTTTACSDIYLAEKFDADKFGSIRFMCESDDVREVEASIAYLAGIKNGTCAASATDMSSNYHIGRLGISCPVGSSREYVYDDTYFECRGLGTFTFDYVLTIQDPDVYVCVDGDFCGADACNFAFEDLAVIVDFPSLIVDKCIETTETITSFATVAPGPSSSFDYSVRFGASWAIRYDSDASIATCTSANPAVIVSCENDARIDFVTATDTSMNCTEISTSILQCIGDLSKITDQFTSVFYVSVLLYVFDPLIHTAMINNYVVCIYIYRNSFPCCLVALLGLCRTKDTHVKSDLSWIFCVL